MTVAEFIEWLKTQDQGATVEVVEHTSGRGYYDQGGNASVQSFDPKRHVEYTDCRSLPFVPDSVNYQRRTLLLGLHGG